MNDIQKGSTVRIKRSECYWYNECGTVVTIESNKNVRYPILVRFTKVNYAGTNTTNFGFHEVEAIKSVST